MQRIIEVVSFILVVLAIDWYFFQGIKAIIRDFSFQTQLIWQRGYIAFSLISISLFAIFRLMPHDYFSDSLRRTVPFFLFIILICKFIGLIPLLLEDIWRVTHWISKFVASKVDNFSQTPRVDMISRTKFLAMASTAFAAVPLLSMAYGVLQGAHDYRVKRVKLKLPNLPASFEGLKLAQISDIHAGSFFNPTAVKRGIDLLIAQKPDLLCFTGDLVNNIADEMDSYWEIFKEIKAPLGVFSVTGNHDYGDYVGWESEEAKAANFQNLMNVHKKMGWRLLMNEHEFIQRGADAIAVIGIENWSAKGRFPKYGSLSKAYPAGSEAAVKILLSHDPSHWEAEVLTDYKDIDLMLSGHTHGFQFGVDIPGFKWSPVQYVYKQWAGLYTEGKQNLYVNKGFGYLGFPGRIGMPPEITIIEFQKA